MLCCDLACNRCSYQCYALQYVCWKLPVLSLGIAPNLEQQLLRCHGTKVASTLYLACRSLLSHQTFTDLSYFAVELTASRYTVQIVLHTRHQLLSSRLLLSMATTGLDEGSVALSCVLWSGSSC